MSKSIKVVVLMGVLAAVSACASQQEEVVVVEPISVEPTYTGKYK